MNPCPHDLAADAADGGCSICTRLELVEAQATLERWRSFAPSPEVYGLYRIRQLEEHQAEVALLQKSVVQWQGRTGEAQAHVAALRAALASAASDPCRTPRPNPPCRPGGSLCTPCACRAALASDAGQKALDVVRAARRELVPTCCLEYGAPIPSSVLAAWVHPNDPDTPTGRTICKATPERVAVLDALSEVFPGVDR